MTAADFSERIGRVFEPAGGVLNAVDALLGIARNGGLRVDWESGHCRARPLGSESEAAVDVPLPKSVFRAILARVAALGNERVPGAESPYGGKVQIVEGRGSLFDAVFSNTPDELFLILQPVVEKNGVPVHRDVRPSVPAAVH